MPIPRLNELLDAVLAVTGELDLTTVLERIVTAACELVDARYGALGVIGDDDRLTAFVHHGMDAATVARIGQLPAGRGLLGHLITEPAPLRLADLEAHDAAAGFPPHHPPMHGFIGAPIRVREQVFGNLYLTDKRDGGAFSAQDEELVVALAAVAGASIEQARLHDEVEVRGRWREAVLEVSTAALEGEPARGVRTRIAALGRSLVAADAASLLVVHDGRLLVAAVDGSCSQHGELESGRGLAASVVADGQARRGVDQVVFGGREAVWVPVRSGERVAATLGAARDAPFLAGDERLLASFAEQASLALTHERTQADLARLSLIEDRERIGRDLHDTVIQRLFATGLSLQAMRRRVEQQPELIERLERAVDDIDTTVKEIRSTIFALQADDGGPRGARSEVLDVVEELSELLPRPPRVRFEGPIDTLVPASVAEHLGPVVRESLTNVAKHAAADDVELELAVDGTDLTLTISDDGRGMAAGVTRGSGFGLRNLDDRARSLGGRLTIGSRQRGGGTVLVWKVPMGP